MINQNGTTEHGRSTSPKEGREKAPDGGNHNTWLGDTEEVYDAYQREPYTRKDCSKDQGRHYRHENEYPNQDEGTSRFSLERKRSNYDDNIEQADSDWDDDRYNQRPAHLNYYAADLRDEPESENYISYAGRESGYDPYYNEDHRRGRHGRGGER